MISVVMPTYRDSAGVWGTVQSLLLEARRHGLIDQLEIVVADNCPDSAEGKECEHYLKQIANARYVPCPDPVGSAATKNRAISEAAGDWVLCIDSHVMLDVDVLPKLVEWCEGNEAADLFHGPLVSDKTGEVVATHFTTNWGTGGMLGTWAKSERCLDESREPAQIMMSGMGCFLTRRETWLGFHSEMRGFGMEEGYIHEKYRAAGRTSYCLPWMRWIHRFRVAGVSQVDFPNAASGRLRNYLLSYTELGYPTWDELYATFLKGNKISGGVWADLCKETGAKPGVERKWTPKSYTRKAPEPELHHPDADCIHRGPVIRQEKCQLCGARGQMFDVHACDVHGECSRSKKSSRIQSCVSCTDLVQIRTGTTEPESIRSGLQPLSHQ